MLWDWAPACCSIPTAVKPLKRKGPLLERSPHDKGLEKTNELLEKAPATCVDPAPTWLNYAAASALPDRPTARSLRGGGGQ